MRDVGGAFGHLAKTTAMTAAILALAATLATSAGAATRRYAHNHSHAYDGLWSVSILTDAGPCDPSARYPARIIGGQVTQADGDLGYQITGAVVESGAIAVTVSRSGHSATGTGRLRGVGGGGRWASDGNECSGTWSAMRRAAN